jgi:lysylphosphatidylglycerol synthetase-like protein (DUF2156 family)
MADQGKDDDGEDDDRVIYHPNQDKAASKATKAIVVLLLLVTGALTLIITIGGWKNLQGATVLSIMFIIVFFVMAWFVAKWNRGVLPLAAGLGVVLFVFAAIASFGQGNWFDRDHAGYDKAGIPPSLLGLLTLVMLPVLFLLVAFSLRAFSQKWNVEVEMSRDEFEEKYGRDSGSGSGGGYGQTQTA